ncbi:uncharacterized protein KY384_005786 [Bacidia gigantensis]|uniref:uncharacterized protein n=1 Tax=Bacidia gigantensis TaxID=2732470 RepID=UPI001D05A532|nr:uncharacterized protein KY384_005786 [Bacidia gigantensis]KAG8529151.1 hypothetical protein KY384_005786 [Bacidia gigantensis]
MKSLFLLVCIVTLLSSTYAAFSGGGGRAGGGASNDDAGAGAREGENEGSNSGTSRTGEGDTAGTYGTAGGDGSSSGSTATHEQDPLGDALDALSDIIKELADKIGDAVGGSGSSTSQVAFSTQRSRNTQSAARRPSQTSSSLPASITGDATGCLSVQQVYSSCSQAFTSTTGDAIDQINNDIQKGDFADAGARSQASCLCYTSATNASTPLWVATQYDGWVSQCNKYLQTASIPASVTVTDTATVSAAAVKSQLGAAVGLCSKAGDVRAPTTAPAVTPISTPTGAASKVTAGTTVSKFTEAIFSTMASASKSSGFLNLDHDVLTCVMDYVPRKDAIMLASTCKSLKHNHAVLRAIYRILFNRSDVCMIMMRWRERGGGTSTPSVSHGIDAVTGPLVHNITLGAWTTPEDMHRLNHFCTRIRKIDFTELNETMDCTRYETDNNDWCKVRFVWPPLRQLASGLFRNLRHAALNYGVYRYRQFCEPSSQQLPVFFQAAPQLETLELEIRPRMVSISYFDMKYRVEPFMSRFEATYVLLNELESAPPSLKTISFTFLPRIVSNMAYFIAALDNMSHLQTIKFALHGDLAYMQDNESSAEAIDYVKDLGTAIQSRRCRILVDQPNDYSLDGLDPGFGKLICHPGMPAEALKRMNFNPIYPWLKIMSISLGEPMFTFDQYKRFVINVETFPSDVASRSLRVWDEVRNISDYFFKLQQNDLPVTVALDCMNSGAFFAPIWPRPKEASILDLIKDDTFSAPSGIETLTGLNPPRDGAAPYETPMFLWGLPLIDHSISDLRIHYGECFSQIWEIMRYNLDELPALGGLPDLDSPEILDYFRGQIEARLKIESKGLALLFRSLQKYHKLNRLALYMPAALYPDHDQTFIDCCLPAGAWTVQHEGSGGDGFAQNSKACGPLLKVRQVSKKMCPFIHRVFTRASSVGTAPGYRIVNALPRNNTVRPEVDLKGVGTDMETLLTCEMEEHFVEGWDY